tara:strand:+ start:4 stop:729 length:726 start_codon:yes stop_codon:yes gene_type:complete
MKEYKGKKIEPREIEDITLDNAPHDFHGGKYIGFCNLDGLPHGLGELISSPKDVEFDKEKNIIKVNKKDKHDKTPWSCNGEWEDGVFVKGTYNMPPFSRYEGSFKFDDVIGSGDWELHGNGIELHYRTDENYKNNNVIGHVKGIFEGGSLLEGEILNPSLIEYSQHKGIKKIIYQKANINRVFDKDFGAEINISFGEIFYEDGAHYKGELDFDLPYGIGTMTLADGNKKTCHWVHGNIQEK